MSVIPYNSGTPWPMIVKFCTRNLHVIWKISTEKKFGKSKKIFLKFLKFFLKFFWNFWNYFFEKYIFVCEILENIYITKIICPSVCLSVTTRSTGTPWPMIVKFYMRNLVIIWKISTEKNFENSKKNFDDFFFFSKFFQNFFELFKNFFHSKFFGGIKIWCFSARAAAKEGAKPPQKRAKRA